MLNMHHKATGFTWYKKWHNLRFSGLTHGLVAFAFFSFSVVSVYQVSVMVPNVKGDQKNMGQENVGITDENDGWEQYKSSRSRMKDIKEKPDGTWEAKIFSAPVQYIDKAGNWVDIDANIKALNAAKKEVSAKGASGKKNEMLQVSKAPYKAEFSTNAGTNLTITSDTGVVKSTFFDTNNTAGIVTDNSILYRDVYPMTDIVRTFTGEGVKQDIVLKGSGHPYIFREMIDTEFEVRLQADNSIIYYKNDKVAGYTPPIYVLDARSRVVPVRLSYQEKILEINIDEKSRIVYPAVVDPTFTPNPTLATGDGYTGPNPIYANSVALYAGTYYDDYYKAYSTDRSVIRFDTSALGSGSTVTAANLYLYHLNTAFGSSTTVLYRNTGAFSYTNAGTPTLGSIDPGAEGAWRNTAINDLSYINKTGYTWFTLLGNEVQNGNYDTTWASYGGSYKPYMVVTYNRPVPGPPTNPGGAGLSTTSIQWTWTDATSYEDGYRVLDSSDLSLKCEVATPNATSCTESTGLSANTAYTRYIRSYNAESGESANSSLVTRYTLTNVPTSPGATAVSNSEIEVTWGAPASGGVDHYHVKSSSNGYASVKYDGSNTNWSETGLAANSQYTYRIYGVNANNVESATYATVSKYTLTNAPTSPTATASSNAVINPISWTAPAGGVDHYHAYSSTDNYSTPIYNSTGTSTSQSGLATNTQYTYRIYGVNAESFEGTTYASVSRFTLANVPGDPTATTVSSSVINIIISPNSNPVSTQFEIQETISGNYVNKATGALQVAEDWGTYAEFGSASGKDVTGLTANKQYSFKVRARNGDSVNTAFNTNAAVKYTLPTAPNVTPTTAGWSNVANVTYTNVVGFGNGGAVYKYVWDQSATWDGTGGTDWTSGTLTKTMLPGANYLHLKSYSTDWSNPLTPVVNLGPFSYDAAPPTGTTLSWGTVSPTAIVITAGGATDDLSGLRGDSLTYYIERDNNATVFATADANSGWSTGVWSQSGLTANTAYVYRVKARDAVGNESGWITASPAYKYTQTNKPVLDDFPSPTNDSTPQIASSTTDSSLSNTSVNLYVGSTLTATTQAAANGTFIFSNTDWGSNSLTGAVYANIRVRAENGDGLEGESSDILNDPEGLAVDIDAPTAPNTRTAAKEGSIAGADIDDAAWNGHNTGPTVYFGWSGATDPDYSSGLKRYWVYFGPLAGAIPRTDGQATSDTTTNIIKTLSNPVSGTDYYLRIQTEDNAGNISSDGAIPTLFVYKFDNVAPSNIATLGVNPGGWSTVDAFNFNWIASTDSHSGLKQYSYIRRVTEGTEDWESWDLEGRLIDPGATTLSGISSLYSGVNTLKLKAVDMAGNQSSEIYVNYLYAEPVSGPDNVAVDYSQSQSQKVNMLRFYWSDYLGATGYYYSINATPTMQNATFVANNDTGFRQFSGVLNGQNNIFYVATQDSTGAIGWGNPSQVSFSLNTIAPGLPTALSITDSSSRESARWQLTISWDEPEDKTPDFDGYVIERGTDGVIFSELDVITKRQDDTIPNGYLDTNLNNTTVYYYRVRSHDNTGNTSNPSTVVYRMPTGKYTSPPTYTSQPTADPKATAVTVTWTTNRNSNSIVQYGPTTVYGQEVSKSTEAVTAHTIDILGLTPGMTYHFRVQSLDAERDYDPALAFSADATFNTSQAPGISNVSTAEIRLTSAIVTWKTTSAATSRILYGTTTSYGSTYVDNSGSQTTTHTVKLDGLKDSTTYHYRIQGTDIEGNTLVSDDYVFETLTFPRISDLELSQIPTAATATVDVTFRSNVPTTSLVTFSGGATKSAADYELVTEHKVRVAGLVDNTQYTVTVRGRDGYGNEATSITRAFKTDFDTRPPQVKTVTTETEVSGYGVDAKGQIIVSWETDEPSTSQIEYGIGSTGNYTNKTQEDTALSTTHVVIISQLKPSSPYHFRVVSRDGAGNTVESEEYSALTPQANRSIFDAILNSLDRAIGWLFRG
jgi:hypothetical protein